MQTPDELDALLKARRLEYGYPEPMPKPLAAVVKSVVAAIPQPTPEEIQARETARLEMERRRQLAERHANLEKFLSLRGARYAECRLGNYKADTAKQVQSLEMLTEYCENVADRITNGVNLVLVGPAGTGKDHLMTAVCRAAILAGRNLLWRNGQDLWGDFRDAISNEANEAATIRRFVSADVLAISDPLPPRGLMSEFQVATLFRIVDGRYSHMRPTFVTLNVASRAEAEERMGLQIVDRLCHGALVVGCNWSSYRK